MHVLSAYPTIIVSLTRMVNTIDIVMTILAEVHSNYNFHQSVSEASTLNCMYAVIFSQLDKFINVPMPPNEDICQYSKCSIGRL